MGKSDTTTSRAFRDIRRIEMTTGVPMPESMKQKMVEGRAVYERQNPDWKRKEALDVLAGFMIAIAMLAAVAMFFVITFAVGY